MASHVPAHKHTWSRNKVIRNSLEGLICVATRALEPHFDLKNTKLPKLVPYTEGAAKRHGMDLEDFGCFDRPASVFINLEEIANRGRRDCMLLIGEEVGHYLQDVTNREVRTRINRKKDQETEEALSLMNLMELVGSLASVYFVRDYGATRSLRTLAKEITPKDNDHYWGYNIAQRIFMSNADASILGRLARCDDWKAAKRVYGRYVDILPDFTLSESGKPLQRFPDY